LPIQIVTLVRAGHATLHHRPPGGLRRQFREERAHDELPSGRGQRARVEPVQRGTVQHTLLTRPIRKFTSTERHTTTPHYAEPATVKHPRLRREHVETLRPAGVRCGGDGSSPGSR